MTEGLVSSHINRLFVLVENGQMMNRNDEMVEASTSSDKDIQWEEYLNEQKGLQMQMYTTMECISTVCKGDSSILRRWRQHTQRRHLLSTLPTVLKKKYHCDLASQAFCKFYEILMAFPDIARPKDGRIRSLHLCEAPGHFIAALNFFLALFHSNCQWEWKANSLNPHFEFTQGSDMLLTDDLIISHPNNWLFGEDNSGDVTRLLSSLKPFKEFFHLVTADGSCYTQDRPEEQESTVAVIMEAEVQCALAVLALGGTFVLKLYSHFTMRSSRLLLLLIRSFRNVCIFKPPSSKSGNSERYGVCWGFIGVEWMNGMSVHQFLNSAQGTQKENESLLSSSRFFSQLQMDAIEGNIQEFNEPTIDKEHLEMARSQAIGKVLSAMKAQLLLKVEESEMEVVSLHDAQGQNPWKSLHASNYVEELRELGEKERAEEHLRQRLREECMKFDGSPKTKRKRRNEEEEEEESDEHEKNDRDRNEMSEGPLEIEWSKEELEWINQCNVNQPEKELFQVAVVFVSHSSSFTNPIHSLFVDLRLWKAVETLHPGCTIDMCPLGHSSTCTLSNALDECIVQCDEKGIVDIHVDTLSPSGWMKLLKRLRERKNEQMSCESIRLLLPHKESSSSFPRTLILSRFSASLLAILSVLFFKCSFKHPNTGIIVQFDLPNYAEDLPEGLDNFIDGIKERIDNGERCLSFVPPSFFSQFHPLILTFNERQLQKISNSIPL